MGVKLERAHKHIDDLVKNYLDYYKNGKRTNNPAVYDANYFPFLMVALRIIKKSAGTINHQEVTSYFLSKLDKTGILDDYIERRQEYKNRLMKVHEFGRNGSGSGETHYAP